MGELPDQPMIRHRLERVEVRELIFPNRCVAIAFVFSDDAGELMIVSTAVETFSSWHEIVGDGC